jgi:diguanylate cyclase
MSSIFHSFLINMALIITCMFLGLKIKEFFLKRFNSITILIWFSPIVVGLLSVYVMQYPLEYEGMRFDLRNVPIFFISYIGGWKLGLFSIIFPSYYRFELGGPTSFQGIIFGVIIPYLIGSLFHKGKSLYSPNIIIQLKHLMTAYTVNIIVMNTLILVTTPVTFLTIVSMIVFETIAILSIGFMLNDANKNFLLKKELEYQSNYDTMTNIPNLRYFKERVERLSNGGQSFVIAMFDVDYFKNFNDTHGHPAGDVVLRSIGQLLTDNMRKNDLFARYGGEEFIVCFSHIKDIQEARLLAEQFREKLELHKFLGEESQPNGKITISIGLSNLSNGTKLSQLIEEADQSLYEAKRSGRNRVGYLPFL